MRCERGQSGMSLMELLVAMAVILILISTLIGVGGYVKTRANLDLTKATLETLSTALEKYYADQTPNDFPPELADESQFETFLGLSAGDISLSSPVPDGGYGFSSAALFYFLDKNPSSRAIVETVSNSLVTNKDADGADITININGTVYDLPRYVDPWRRGNKPGTSIRYEYLTGTAFPVLTSAGPDKIFDTPDDITSK